MKTNHYGSYSGDLKQRTFDFSLRILRITSALPNNVAGWELGKQLIRSGTSIGANVSEADHAFTDADFYHKCSLARKEAAESHDWLRLCQEAKLLGGDDFGFTVMECEERTRILTAIVRSTKQNQ